MRSVGPAHNTRSDRSGDALLNIKTSTIVLLQCDTITTTQMNPATNHAELVRSPVEDITLIRWDQRTFMGRLNHFSRITDPRLLLKSRKDVESAQKLYQMAKYIKRYACTHAPH